MAKKQGKGRPPSPDRKELKALHVDIPDWLKQMLDEAAEAEGRKLRVEVARRLKAAFGLPPDAKGPPPTKGKS